MKKTIITIFTFATLVINAQDIKDVLRYSQENIKGTARFQAMSGAFGALGGDLSSISINPAGGAVFLNNHGAATLGLSNKKNNTTFSGSNSNTKDSNFNISQIGGIAIFDDLKSNKWKNVSLGFNYDNTGDFNNEIFSRGTNNKSIDSYFLNYANGIKLGNIQDTNFYDQFFDEQQATLGYETFIINPLDDNNINNTIYNSNVAQGTYLQQNIETTSGFNGKIAFNLSANYDDKLYIGMNLNGHFIDFRSTQIFTETNSNIIPAGQTRVNNIRFENELYTYGSGFSLQVGAIYKPISNLRFGVALNSPTWYQLFDEARQGVTTSRFDMATNLPSRSEFLADVIIYEPYNLRTPWKATGSFAYVFGKKGLISIDYALTDYSFMKAGPSSNYFNGLNREIENTFKTAGELRIGAEYKIKKFSLRGGYRYQDSSLKGNTNIGETKGYSAGLGYAFNTFKLDLAYSKIETNTNNPLFRTGLTNGVLNQNNNSNFSLTFSSDLN
jgi:hypothetical protein